MSQPIQTKQSSFHVLAPNKFWIECLHDNFADAKSHHRQLSQQSVSMHGNQSALAQYPLRHSSLHLCESVLLCMHLPWSGSQIFEGQVGLLHCGPPTRFIAQAPFNEQLHFSGAFIGVRFVIDAPQRLLGYLTCADLPQDSPKTAM